MDRPFSAKGAALYQPGPSAQGAGKGPEIRGRAESPFHARTALVWRSGRWEETCGVHGSGFQPSTGVVRGWPCVPGPVAQAEMKRAFGAQSTHTSARSGNTVATRSLRLFTKLLPVTFDYAAA
jgi:hypothetical protein